jgi:hypothetical protein
MRDLAIFLQAVVTEFKIVPEEGARVKRMGSCVLGDVLAALFLSLSGLFCLIDVWRQPIRLSSFEIAFMLFAS